MALNPLYKIDSLVPEHLLKAKVDSAYRKLDLESFDAPSSGTGTETLPEIIQRFLKYADLVKQLQKHLQSLEKEKKGSSRNDNKE